MKLNSWIEQGEEFGKMATRELGMVHSKCAFAVKAAMVLNGMTLALPVRRKPATTYSFNDDKFLYVAIHRYRGVSPNEPRLEMVMFPMEKLSDLDEAGILRIVNLATAYLGQNPDELACYITPEKGEES